MKLNNSLVIGIVGPCAAGKTTLITRLRTLGYEVRHIAQEHSYVQDMWQRITNPDVLVYLQVSYPVSLSRRKLKWSRAEYDQQIERLQHARTHADLIVDTDPLSPAEVSKEVESFLNLQTQLGAAGK